MDWVIFFVLFSSFLTVFSEEDEVRRALVQFMVRLSPKNMELGQNYGWNETSDPCKDKWQGVICDSKVISVKKIVLDQFNFSGTLDAASLCTAVSLTVLSLNDNSIAGELPEEILNCRQMTHLYLSRNRFSGNLPASLSRLVNLKRIDISDNNFSGQLPDLPKVSGLISFLAQNNLLSGRIPDFDFSNLLQFNVSNNRFTGPIPQVNGHFDERSFLNNPGLCGLPLSIPCPSPKTSEEERNQAFMYGGYVILGLILVFLLALKFFRKIKSKPEEKNSVVKTDTDTESSSIEKDSVGEYVSESGEIAVASSSLVVLRNADLNEMTFEDLLRAPAELIERGKHGSLYKVVIGGMRLVVKRIRDWDIKDDDFRRRMDRISETQHPNVLPVVAYYCSRTERLLVYEFLQNGSLYNLIKENGRLFDWGSRISVAANLAEALAFMHKELHSDGIGHGNLKSSNILLNKDVDDPVITEYGLMVVKSPNTSSNTSTTTYQHDYDIFKGDVYRFGVILLELLTGRLQDEGETDGSELAKWVQSVIREEWTVEVFDKGLTSEGASQERMLNLLQLALKCTNLSPEARPSMDRVAAMVNSVREDEERSISSEPWE